MDPPTSYLSDSENLPLAENNFSRDALYYSGRRLRPVSACLRLALAIIVAVILFAFSLTKGGVEHGPPNGGHVLPTLLSVVDENNTGHYISALENPLYDGLKQGYFMYYDEFDVIESNRMVEAPELFLDRSNINLRDPLTISWTLGKNRAGEAIVEGDDILALYCSGQVWQTDLNNKQFMDAATIAQARATSHKHGGELKDDASWHFPSFPVLRHSVCSFSLYQTLPGNAYVLLASSGVFHIADAETMPTAIHLGLGNSIEEMVVQFKTGDKTPGVPVVRYGLSGETMDLQAYGLSHTYTANDMCQEPATCEAPGKFQPPGMIHVVRLTGLECNRTYQYQAGFQQVGGASNTTTWSDTYSFTSAPLVQANSEPFSYVVYGDQGCPSRGWGDGGVWTAAWAARELHSSLPIRAVHHIGDLSYAIGIAHMWDDWFHMISSFSASVPLMIAVGNHEYGHTAGGDNDKDPSGVLTPGGYHPSWGNFRNDSGGECGVPTANLFTMPNGTKQANNGVFWYSWDFANVHTTVISSEHDLSPGSIQYQWLEADLQSVNRSLTPWLVLELHRPMYESEMDWYDYPVGVARRVQLEDLLKRYQVNLVLGGHYHSYLRTCNGLYQSKCNNGGPMHITIGSAGAPLNDLELFPNAWTEAFVKQKYGYGRITVVNATALHFEFVQATSPDDADAGNVLDDVWLFQERLTSDNIQIGILEQEE